MAKEAAPAATDDGADEEISTALQGLDWVIIVAAAISGVLLIAYVWQHRQKPPPDVPPSK